MKPTATSMPAQYLFPRICLFLFFLLFITACQNDDEIPPMDTPESSENPIIIDHTRDLYTGDISGIVLNHNQLPLAEVNIRVSNELTQTDANGYFSFKNILLDANGTLIKVYKNGFVTTTKMIQAEKETTTKTKILLSEITAQQSFMSNEAKNLIFGGQQLEIQLEANSFSNGDGTPYEGEVSVQVFFLNPEDPLMAFMAPGDFRAFNSDSELRILQSFGMFSIDAHDAAGNKLIISANKEVILKYDMSSSIVANAPNTMPMWHFNAASGYWVEEGEATLESSLLIGKVKHFSWWNFDVPFPLVNLRGSVSDSNGNGVEGIGVTAQLVNANVNHGIVFTNDEGIYQGFVPANEELQLKFYNDCNDPFFEGNASSLDTDLFFGDILFSDEESINLCGTLLDCEQNTVTDGYVILKFGENATIINIDDQGDFCSTVFTCGADEFEIIGVDLSSQLQSAPQTFEIDNSPFDLSVLSACDQLATFFKYTVDGQEYFVQNFSVGRLGEEIFFQDDDNFQNTSGILSSANWGASDFMLGYYSVNLDHDPNIDMDLLAGGQLSVMEVEYNGVGEYFYIKLNGYDPTTELEIAIEIAAILE